MGHIRVGENNSLKSYGHYRKQHTFVGALGERGDVSYTANMFQQSLIIYKNCIGNLCMHVCMEQLYEQKPKSITKPIQNILHL